MPDKTIYESLRIKQLIEEFDADKDKAINRFWEDVKSAGIPFIEPCETESNEKDENDKLVDQEYVLATFLYEGDENTRTVNLGANFMGRMDENPDNWRMQQIAETNIWYWTEKVSKDLRTGYFVTPNLRPPQAMDTPEKRHAFLKSICLPDPLNKKRFERPFYPFQLKGDNERLFQSVFEAPAAIPDSYAKEREDVVKGKLTEHRYQSQYFDYEHVFWIYTPPNYDSMRAEPYPFLLVFDGYMYLEALKLPTILDNLIAEGKIPPIICMMLNSEAETRFQELSPNELMYRAIAEDWMPFIQTNYPISTNPAHNIIGGMSLGGLAAAWNAFKNSHIFGNVVSQSGSFWWSPAKSNPKLKAADELEDGWLIRQFIQAEKMDIHFYMDVGRYETDGEDWNHRNLNRHMRDVLRAKGYSVHYQEYAGFHDHVCWQITIVDALLALL